MDFRDRGICTAFGIEWRFDFDDAGAEALHHVLDDMVAADAQATGSDLRRQMAIAEVPGNANQMCGLGAANLDQRLGGSDHLDQPAVFQHQRIATSQRDGGFEVEQELEPAGAGHRHAAAMPIVEIEHDGVGCGFLERVLALDVGGADHGRTLILVNPRRRVAIARRHRRG